MSDMRELLSDQKWRLNNLYTIRDKSGERVKFSMNKHQEKLFEVQWYRNLILKARQLGFTTFIDLFILDTCLFNPDVKAGIIAHNREDANAIFDEKIKFVYENLDPIIRKKIQATTDRAGELKFSNGSSVRVSTSFRSGTLQILHVSEMGKIASKYPERAREIVTGAFEAVATGQQIFVESTAEGRAGVFYDMAMNAKASHDSRSALTKLDFKFHFFAWHENKQYRMVADNVVFSVEDEKYFKDLEARGIKTTREQQGWWVKKHELLGEEMFREHPSYPEEAFKASIIGAYYGKTITQLRRKGRIATVDYEPGFPVDTGWDLGMNGATAIWFIQHILGERRVIDYVEGTGTGLGGYAKILAAKPYVYGTHYLPHDIRVRELGSGVKRIDTLQNLGVRPISVVPRPKNGDQLVDQINQTRDFLSNCWFDQVSTSEGLKCLENYRREWDDKLGTYKNNPRPDWASHGADAFRTLAIGYKPPDTHEPRDLLPDLVADY